MIQLVAKKMIIENQIDIEIFSAFSGEEALEKFNLREFDIIILDIIMPGMSGVEVLKNINDWAYTEGVKVIMLTSVSDKALIKDCFQMGAFDYITKPIEEDEFVARIQNAVHQRQLERKLSASVAKMKEQNEALRKTQLQLVQKEQMASMGHLAAGVAHEINNPLGFVISNFDVIKDYIKRFETYIDYLEAKSNDTEDEPEDLYSKFSIEAFEKDLEFIRDDLIELYKDMDEGLDRVKRIVEGLRSFSRVDQLEEYEAYSLNEGIETLMVLTKNEIDGYAVLELDLQKPLPKVRAIGYQINQTLLNLFMNALDSIKEKMDKETHAGVLRVKTFQTEDFVGCTIWDNGMGIAPSKLNDIFKPFYSQSKAKSGIGLGLSISYDIIVNRHDGRLEVQSEAGEFAAFTMMIPIAQSKDGV